MWGFAKLLEIWALFDLQMTSDVKSDLRYENDGAGGLGGHSSLIMASGFALQDGCINRRDCWTFVICGDLPNFWSFWPSLTSKWPWRSSLISDLKSTDLITYATMVLKSPSCSFWQMQRRKEEEANNDLLTCMATPQVKTQRLQRLWRLRIYLWPVTKS